MTTFVLFAVSATCFGFCLGILYDAVLWRRSWGVHFACALGTLLGCLLTGVKLVSKLSEVAR